MPPALVKSFEKWVKLPQDVVIAKRPEKACMHHGGLIPWKDASVGRKAVFCVIFTVANILRLSEINGKRTQVKVFANNVFLGF